MFDGCWLTCTRQAHEIYPDLAGQRPFAEDVIELGQKQMAFQSLAQQRCHLFPVAFFSNKYLFLSTKQAKPHFPCFSLCCHYSLAFESALACWFWNILVFKYLEVIELQGMKDDLSLGDAHPKAPCPLLRHTRLQVLSLFCTWYCVSGRRAGAALAMAVAEQQEG